MKKTIVLALAILATSVGANAAILFTTPQAVSTGLYQTNGNNQLLVFNQFNGPGTLLGVEITLQGYGEAGYEVVNDLANAATTFQFTGAITVILQNPLGGNFVTTIPTPTDIQRVVADGATYFTPNYDIGQRSLQDIDNDGPTLFNAPGVLAIFSGGGTINLNSSATINTQFNADNDVTSSVSSRAQSDVTIRYQYDDSPAVPEPTSMVLGGTALLGMGLLARRRAAKK